LSFPNVSPLNTTYSLINYKYQFNFFYGIKTKLYNNSIRWCTVAHATVRQATVIQQTALQNQQRGLINALQAL
jgi:hypothetical protein